MTPTQVLGGILSSLFVVIAVLAVAVARLAVRLARLEEWIRVHEKAER